MDWWAVGCIIYELYCGNSPFFSPSNVLTCQKIINREVYWPADLPEDVKDLLDRLLTVDVEQRLGCGKEDGFAVKKHRYFQGMFMAIVLLMMIRSKF